MLALVNLLREFHYGFPSGILELMTPSAGDGGTRSLIALAAGSDHQPLTTRN